MLYRHCGVGAARVAKIEVRRRIALYAFPIQQAYVHLASQPEWRLNIVFALPITICFAAFSWHCVEKHVLKLKKPLFRNERKHAGETTMRFGRPVISR